MRRSIFFILMAVFAAGFCLAPRSAWAAGTLIKGSDPAVYYLADNGKRYVFPNERIYFSWYADFSGVTTVADTQLAKYAIGGNVTYRAGTRLVKLQSVPNVYAVESGGVLHWVTSESIANTLYGADWASRVDDLPDGFFPSYAVGEDIKTAWYPSGTLLKDAATGSFYVMWDGQRRAISDAALAANGYQASNAITSDTTELPDGTAISGEERDLSDTAETDLGPKQGNAVLVSAESNPATVFVGGNDETIGTFTFSLARQTTINSLHVTLKANTNGDSDADPGGLIRGDGTDQIEPAFTGLHFVDADGSLRFNGTSLSTDQNGDGSQTLAFSGSETFAAGRHTLKLVADIPNDATVGEKYVATLLADQSVFTVNGTATTDVSPASAQGDEYQVKKAALTVELGTKVSSGYALRGNSGPYDVVQLRFENPTDAAVSLKAVTLTGYIDENEGNPDFTAGADEDEGSFTSVSDVVDSVSLVNASGTTLKTQSLIGSDGSVRFDAPGVNIAAHAESDLTVQVKTSANAPYEFGSDRIAFDLSDKDNLDAETADGVRLDVAGVGANGGVSPHVFLTVSKHGTLIIDGSGEAPVRVITGSTGNQMYLLTLTASKEEDIDVKSVTMRLTEPGSQRSSSHATMTWTDAGVPMTASANSSNGSFLFTGMDMRVPKNTALKATVLMDVNLSTAGGTSGDELGLAFDPATFAAAGALSGFAFSSDDIGDTVTDRTQVGNEAVVRKDAPTMLLSAEQPASGQARNQLAPMLRFTTQAAGDGSSRIRTMTFKITTSDVGTKTGGSVASDNDLLEKLADVNGDAADDNGVADLVDLSTGNVQGEGSSGHIDYAIYDASAKTRDATPQGLDSATGDYGLLTYTFTFPLLATSTLKEYELDLDTSGLAPGDQTVHVDLLDGDDFTWDDGVSYPIVDKGTSISRLPMTGKTIEFP